jgi:hypothetical protein
MDWIDDLLSDEPISLTQIAIIEGLLSRCPYPQEKINEIETGLLELSDAEASELIFKMKQDEIPLDPREQFKRMFRDGN